MNKNRKKNYVLKPNAAKALKLSALFAVVFMMILASLNLPRPQGAAVISPVVYEPAPNTGMVTGTLNVSSITVTTAADPADGGTVTPSASIPKGTSITLNAQPAKDYKFVGWKNSAGEYVSNAPSYVTPELQNDTVFTAVFSRNTFEIVTKSLMTGDYGNLFESDEGGSIYGGGTLLEGELRRIRAVPSNNALYEFVGWYYKQSGVYYPFQEFQEDPLVGYNSIGADINPAPGQTLYAAFKRREGPVILTATMIPAIGSVKISDHELFPDEISAFLNNEASPATASDIDYESSVRYVYFSAYLPDTTSHNLTGDDDEKKPKSQYTLTHVNYRNQSSFGALDYSDDSGVYRATLDSSLIQGNTDVFIHYKGYDASFNNTCAVATVPYPSDAGTTGGDMASTGAFTTTIWATPSEGYMFDHWEWYDPDTGVRRTSKESSLSIGVSGLMTCKAFFRPEAHTVSVSSISPMEGGYVKEGLGLQERNTPFDVNIVANEGYEFQSVSYTTMDGITHTFDTSTIHFDEIKEDIFLNIVFKKTGFMVAAKPQPVKPEGGTGYNRVTLTSGSETLSTNEDGSAVELELNSQGSITLEAFPDEADGYRFEEWVGTDGTVSTANPFTPSSVADDVTYIAKFEKEKYVIRVNADPSEYGTVSVGADESSLSALGQYEVKSGENAYIKAEPKAGYQFLYWTNSAGTRLTSDKITLEDIKNDETYTAHFAGTLELTVEPSPSGYGEVQVGNNGYVTSSTTYRFSPNEQVTLTARPLDNASYKFLKWVNSNGEESTDAKWTVTVKKNVTYTALFASDSFTIQTVADPVTGGTANVYHSDEAGTEQQTEIQGRIGETVKLIAKPAAGYQFLYWTSSTGTRYNKAETVIKDVGSDEVFTAHFYPEKVIVTIDGTPAGAGSYKLNDKEFVSQRSGYEVAGKSNITLTAKADEGKGYIFAGWVDSYGNSYSANPLQITEITKDTVYTAKFEKEKYMIRVNADPSEYGTVYVGKDESTLSALGEYEATNGEDAYIKAEPKDGYAFLYWTNSAGSRMTSAELKLEKIKSDETYTAHFAGTVELTVEPSPSGYGEVQLGNNGYVTASTTYRVTPGEQVTLTARPTDNASYKFLKWVNSEGEEYDQPQWTVKANTNVTYTALFGSDSFTINTIADPVTGGTANIYRMGDDETAQQTSINGNIGETVKLIAKPADGYEFLYWTSSTGTRYNKAVTEIQAAGNDEVFTAHFYAKSVTVTIDGTPEGAGAYQLNDNAFVSQRTNYEVAGRSNIKLTAKADETNGYVFAGWVDNYGNSYPNNPLQITEVTKDITYTAKFDKEKYLIRVNADPSEYGTVYVGADASSLSALGEYEVNSGGSAYIKAVAKDGNQFLYWTNSTGTRLTSAELTLDNIKSDETYTAHFAGTIELTIEPSPSGYGEVQLGTNGYVTASTTYRVSPGETVTLTARPTDNASYQFLKWVSSDGRESREAQWTVTANANVTYTALFGPKSFSMKTIADPITGGTANIYRTGDDESLQQTEINGNIGETVKLIARAADGYDFLYWTSSTGTRYNDAETVIQAAGNDEVFTAHFYPKKVKVTIDGTPKGTALFRLNDNDYVSVPTTYEVDGKSNITLTAKADDATGYQFVEWVDNYGNSYPVNPLQITEVTKDITYTAVFDQKEQEIGIVVRSSPAEGGTLEKLLNGDGSADIKVTPNPGYIFTGWSFNDQIITTEKNYHIDKVIDGLVYTAMFTVDKSYKPVSDIPSEKAADTDRKESKPGYTVTRESVLATAKKMASRYQVYSGVPNSYAAYGKNVPGKFAEVNDRSALLMAAELVTTDKEMLTAVSADLAEAAEMAAQFTEQKFGTRYKNEILAVKQVTADPQFANRSHTYLLKNTGAAYKDNVYILYGSRGGAKHNSGINGFDWVTCMVDEAGTLRFTIPSFSSSDYFIVVKTWPE